MSKPIVDFLAEFVSLQSISSDPEKKTICYNTAEFLAHKLTTLGVETILQQERKGKNPIVLGKLGEEEDLPTFVIYGHYDVQPATREDGWNTNPFELTKISNNLFGRGTTDDKGPITSTIFAIEDLTNQGDVPVNLRFIYEGEEESGSEGFEETITAHRDFFGPIDGIIVMDNYWLGTERPCLTYGLRGLTYMTIEISGPNQDLHSGVEGGTIREPLFDLISVLAQLSKTDGHTTIPGFYDKVRPVTDEEKQLYQSMEFDISTYMENIGVTGLQEETAMGVLMRKWRYPTISIHGIEGAFSGPGGKTVIPRKVIAKVSMRLVPDQDPQQIGELFIQHVKSLFTALNSPNSINVEILSTGDWWIGNPDNFLFKSAEKAIIDVWGVSPLYTREGGTIPIVPFMEKIFDAPAILLAIGQSTDAAHAQNEKIRLLNLTNGTEVIKNFLNYLLENQS